jgi:hypothetical protein
MPATRSWVPFLLLLLTACGPPAPPASQPADPPPAQSTANPDFAALPAQTLTGQWFFRADEGTFSAGFGVPESEFQLVVTCTQGSGAVTVMSDHELAPDQATTLSLITERATLNLPAQSFNAGLANVTAELPGDTELSRAVAAALSAPQTRFAVRVGADARVYPWSEDLTRALAGCS